MVHRFIDPATDASSFRFQMINMINTINMMRARSRTGPAFKLIYSTSPVGDPASQDLPGCFVGDLYKRRRGPV